VLTVEDLHWGRRKPWESKHHGGSGIGLEKKEILGQVCPAKTGIMKQLLIGIGGRQRSTPEGKDPFSLKVVGGKKSCTLDEDEKKGEHSKQGCVLAVKTKKRGVSPVGVENRRGDQARTARGGQRMCVQ